MVTGTCGKPVDNFGAPSIFTARFYFSNLSTFLFFTFPKFSLQSPSNLPSTLQANNKLSFSAPYQIKFDKNKKLYYNKENKKFVW